MDSISQAALGASIGDAMLGRRIGNKGALLGAVVATIPDLDVILLPFFDALQRISIHRGYSHSILFSLIAATLLMLLFGTLKWTREISLGRLWLFSWLALITHMLLDAFTPYGTQLFLPASRLRFGFDSVTIVDPVYTLPLLGCLLAGMIFFANRRKVRNRLNYAGLLVSSIYLLLTLGNKAVVHRTFAAALQEQGLPFERLLTVPVTAANYKWYGAATGSDTLYIGSFGQFQKNPIEFTSIPVNEHLLKNVDPEIVDKLKWFAKDHYTVAGDEASIRFYNLQVDMQGIRRVDGEWAPTAWYYALEKQPDGHYSVESRVHDNP